MLPERYLLILDLSHHLPELHHLLPDPEEVTDQSGGAVDDIRRGDTVLGEGDALLEDADLVL